MTSTTFTEITAIHNPGETSSTITKFEVVDHVTEDGFTIPSLPYHVSQAKLLEKAASQPIVVTLGSDYAAVVAVTEETTFLQAAPEGVPGEELLTLPSF